MVGAHEAHSSGILRNKEARWLRGLSTQKILAFGIDEGFTSSLSAARKRNPITTLSTSVSEGGVAVDHFLNDVKDPLHEKLAPFRQLRHDQHNVWLTSVAVQRAFQNTQRDFVKDFEEHENIHLSKNSAPGKILQPFMLDFRYDAEDEESGLLAAALLWADYRAAGRFLDGIQRHEEGYFTLVEDTLRSLIQRSEARLVVAIAA